MDTIRYRVERDLAVQQDVDVAVIGGGPGGLGAAVMASRAGAKTCLIERYGYLGGMAASGEVHPFMANHAGSTCLDRPVYVEWVRAMRRYVSEASPLRAISSDDLGKAEDRYLSKDLAMLGAEDLCLQAGVTLLYHHQLADVVRTGRLIDAAVLLSKSGYSAVRAKVFVDCTGDADLAVMAGCPFELGGATGWCQPMTLCFKLSHVDRAAAPSPDEVTRLYKEAKARGEIDCPRLDVLQFAWMDDDVVHFNTTRIIHRNGTDGADLAAAEIEGRRQMREFLAFFRRHVPGYERAEIHSVAHHIGVRESRRIRGLAWLTRADFDRCAKFPDAIARVHYPIDIHNPDGGGTVHANLPAGEWYEIPFGCIVPQDSDNLLVGGRPISVDHAVHSSMRVMPPACSIGQAAGMAAAMAAATNGRPADLDGREVRRRLVQQGAYL